MMSKKRVPLYPGLDVRVGQRKGILIEPKWLKGVVNKEVTINRRLFLKYNSGGGRSTGFL